MVSCTRPRLNSTGKIAYRLFIGLAALLIILYRSPTAWSHPNCIFEPTTVREVQFFVGLLAITGSTCAVRSGGHSPFKDFASTDNGILIPMHKMKVIEYDAQSETVRFSMGNNWGDVYGALTPYERVVVGGRLPDVGMVLVTGGMFFPLLWLSICGADGSGRDVYLESAAKTRIQVAFRITRTKKASRATML